MCGIRNNAICKRLLAEENLDLKKAEHIATVLEIAVRDTSELSPSSKAHESTAGAVHQTMMKPKPAFIEGLAKNRKDRSPPTYATGMGRPDTHHIDATIENPSVVDAEERATF